MFAEFPTRRSLLQTACAAAVPFVVPLVNAQSAGQPGYEVSAWSGPLPTVESPDTMGQVWRSADFKGRAVLLNFWATWCEPCRAEMPSLQQMAQTFGSEKLLVLAINFKEPASRIMKFASATGLNLPLLMDPAGNLASQTSVRIFPTTLMIDRNGRPRHRVKGEVDWASAEARALVSSLLAA